MTAIIATYTKKAENPGEIRLGWKVYEEIGIVVINDHALLRVDLSSEEPIKHYVYRNAEK